MEMVQFGDSVDETFGWESLYASLPGYGAGVDTSGSNVSNSNWAAWGRTTSKSGDTLHTLSDILGIWDFGSNYTIQYNATAPRALKVFYYAGVANFGAGVPHMMMSCYDDDNEAFPKTWGNPNITCRFITASMTASTLGWASALSLWTNSYTAQSAMFSKNGGDFPAIRLAKPGGASGIVQNFNHLYRTGSDDQYVYKAGEMDRWGWKATSLSNFSTGSTTITAYGVMFLATIGTHTTKTRQRFWPNGTPTATFFVTNRA